MSLNPDLRRDQKRAPPQIPRTCTVYEAIQYTSEMNFSDLYSHSNSYFGQDMMFFKDHLNTYTKIHKKYHSSHYFEACDPTTCQPASSKLVYDI